MSTLRTVGGWLFAQAVMFLVALLGLVVLIPFCLAHSWELKERSIKDNRPIDRWSWLLLDAFYGNPEDGVSGSQALVYGSQPYMPTPVWAVSSPWQKTRAWLFASWRAYSWSALRNSADALKYHYARRGVGMVVITLKAGYQQENGYNVPVGSLNVERQPP
jgi:hypothetical protein